MNFLVFFVGLLCLASVHAGDLTDADMAADGATASKERTAAAAEEIPESPASPDEETEEPPAEDDFERMPEEADAEQPKLPEVGDLTGKTLTIAGDELKSCMNPYLSYYHPPTTIYGCCPRRWNYSCYSSWYPLPCFYDRSKYNLLSWCCPIAPRIYARRCLCRSCARLTPYCVQQGYCARRFTKKWFLAICYRKNSWAELRAFYKPVATSCYCRSRYPYYYTNKLQAAQVPRSME